MSVKSCCCLCYTPSYDFKLILNEMGESTDAYDVTVKYFDPMILTEDQIVTFTSTTKVLCSECWTHINNFHDFQQNVLKARALMCEGINKTVPEVVVLPKENKEFLSEDDFCEKEQCEFDSELDDIPLTELCAIAKLAPPVKRNTKTCRVKTTCTYVEKSKKGKSIKVSTKDCSLDFVQNRNDHSTYNESEITVRQTPHPQNDESYIQLKPKEELEDDAYTNIAEVFLESPLLKTMEPAASEVIDTTANDILPDSVTTKKKCRRGRKPKCLIIEENRRNSRKLCGSPISAVRVKVAKTLKDPSRTKYLEKCKENDSFIAQWKPSLDCDLCAATATNFDALRSHFRQVHKTKCYIKCCDRKFYRRYVLMGHIRLHVNPETHKCDICGKSSTTKYNLKLHKNIVHGALKQFECEVCHRQFNQKPTLDRHLLTHVMGEKKFFCKECDKGYVLEVQLNSHVKTVHGVDCVCDQCGRTFRGANALKKHLLEHSGVPKLKFACDICGAELTNKNGLRRHKAAYHHDGSTAYVCSICGKIASSENALKSHKKQVHEEKRNHKCTYCGKAFKRPKVLREHVATHTGVDLYQCPHCPQTFKVSANMHHHRKRAHPIEWEEARRNRLNLPKVNIMEVTNQVVL